MTVGSLAMDQMPGVVQGRSRFENCPQFEIHVMVGPKLVKKLQCEPANLFSMFQVAMHAAGEGLRASDHDLGFLPLFVCSLRKRHFRGGEFVEQAFTNTHAWRNHGAKTQPPGDGDQNDGGDAHDLCAVAAHSEGLHPAFHVKAQNLQETLPQQPRVERPQAAESGTGGQRGESLRIAATGDSQCCCGPGTVRKRALQDRENMKSYIFRRIFVNGALDMKCLHQADGSERQADASLEDTSTQLTKFQAAAAEIENESGGVQI